MTLKILSSSKQDLKASVLDACCTYFSDLSIGMYASIFFGIVGLLMHHTFPCIILVTGLGRTLVFIHQAELAESGVNLGDWLTFL
jgi:hypothetical protein